MALTETEKNHFQTNGFCLIPNPFGHETMLEVEEPASRPRDGARSRDATRLRDRARGREA